MSKMFLYSVDLENKGKDEGLEEIITLNEEFEKLGEEKLEEIYNTISSCTLKIQKIIRGEDNG